MHLVYVPVHMLYVLCTVVHIIYIYIKNNNKIKIEPLYVYLSYIVCLVVVHPITDIELRYTYIVKRLLRTKGR